MPSLVNCGPGSGLSAPRDSRSGSRLSVNISQPGLAATRRLVCPADAPPLGTIRSLAYFLPVIEEVLELRVSPDYFQYLRYKLQRAVPTR